MSNSKLYVSITIDWEGEHFRDLADLQTTRATIQASLGAPAPFTHYICPTYWLSPRSRLDPAQAIRSLVSKGDELALHVHCWRSLVELAGVRFLSEPDWNGDGTGHGVPLGAYQDDARAIIACARALLQRKLGATVWGFRCGGAMTSDGVYAALIALGFRYDSSAAPPVMVSRGFRPGHRGNLRDTMGCRNELASYQVDLWGDRPMTAPERANSLSLRSTGGQAITPMTQPYAVHSGARSILEMPLNGGISDYASAGFMTKTFDALLERVHEGAGPMFLNIGCHQEGAGRWKKPLMDSCHGRRRALTSEAVVLTTVAKAARVADRLTRRCGAHLPGAAAHA
ncbi:hypothetical protein G6O69_26640 [Pseudenhygromyxa sp. WMMC2535]|uniref:hypothetical protein n=1 Tax=Pseudenhygromyxa sp. WMMC2535 TaxID=2712867 RepID=UPI001556AF1A|nr:hypothetical protein [Pseudenhygromyxa sp. WMMC2535]NVB41445.1 hypothetical protein [Pseudenhygromyxa sp. WMMC2535]